MPDLKKRRMMLSRTDAGYISEGLKLYFDAEEPFMNVNIDGKTESIWNDRAVNGQKAVINNVIQSGNSTIWDGESSSGKMLSQEYLPMSGILSGCKERTIEVVCKINDTENPQIIILGCGRANVDEWAAGLWYRPASGGFKVGSASDQLPALVRNVADRASYSVVFGDSGLDDYSFYQNMQLCTHGSVGGNMNNYTFVTVGSRYYNNNFSYRFNGEINCIRVYDRKLTDSEREHNFMIDKRRFGIDAG